MAEPVALEVWALAAEVEDSPLVSPFEGGILKCEMVFPRRPLCKNGSIRFLRTEYDDDEDWEQTSMLKIHR